MSAVASRPERPGVSWAGTQRYSAAALVRPESVAELQAIVATSPRVRALGTRHSFNDLADTPGVLLGLDRLPGEVGIDRSARLAEVPAGMPYGVAARAIEAAGFALHNLGSLPHISVGGAVATATHGSGVALGNLATAVRGLDLVTASGELLTIDEGDPRLPGAVVGLGALGVVTRLRLAIEPTYRIRQDVWTGLAWGTLLGDPLAVLGAAYSVSVFTHWGPAVTDQVWVKHRVSTDALIGTDATDVHAARIPGATRSPETGWSPVLPAPVPSGGETTPQGGAVGPWLERLPHFRLDGRPSAGDEIQSEWFVPIADAAEALAAVRSLAERIDPLLITTELRTVAGDGLWLSTAEGGDRLAIHFTWANRPAEVAAILPVIEDALAPFAARPHWGKWFGASSVADRYPLLPEFRRLRAELDPRGRFGNAYLDRVLG